jgi:type VI secretion system secreted protein VgrG
MYRNLFECIPSSTPFRPARVSPKPVIQGSQTAIVVGKKGEEITQDFCRIKVQFHWDRRGLYDENSSCWIRVAQTWAANGWGAISIPRVGQEVVVTFLEGDPDQPLITGSVYNGQQVPPYLPYSPDVKAPPFCPDSAEIMGFRSNTTKGGGGYNEIIIKDTKDKELVRIHGQKDMHTTVLNDQKEIVKNNKNLHVTNELRTQVDEKASHTLNGDVAEHFSKNHAEVVGQERYLKARRIILEADEEICIKVGGNHVHISSAGVYVEGTMVDLNCGHPAANTSLSGLTPTIPEDPS